MSLTTEQAASFGQGLAIAMRMADCFPRDIPHDEVQEIVDDRDFWLDYLAKTREAYAEYKNSKLLPMPADFEVFEMSMDGDDSANDPIDGMVKGRGFTGKWKHKGPRVKGKQTGLFMWVTVGYQSSFDAVRQVCLEKTKDKGGEIPEGQWREEVMRCYQNNGVPRGIADPSWKHPHGHVHFPFVNSDGGANFHWAAHDPLECWRWLVRVSK